MTETAKSTLIPSAPSQRCKHTKTVLSKTILLGTHTGPYALKRRTKQLFCFPLSIFGQLINSCCELVLFTNTK